jgi:hypothetical protein
MSRKIKLIWDFRGQEAENTAKHHEIHLIEYINSSKIPAYQTGNETFGELYSIAFVVVDEENMLLVRDALKPHRAEVF